jgi:hypothetical protein
MHYIDLVIPYVAGILLYLIAPLLSRLVLNIVSGVIARGQKDVPGIREENIPYYLSPKQIGQYLEYAMDVIQVIPALFLPIVGAVYGFSGGIPAPISLTFLTAACVAAFAAMAWILGEAPSDYASRKWHRYSVVAIGGIALNLIGMALSLSFG